MKDKKKERNKDLDKHQDGMRASVLFTWNFSNPPSGSFQDKYTVFSSCPKISKSDGSGSKEMK